MSIFRAGADPCSRIRNKLQSHRGSTLVEAAMVFPLVVLIVFGVIHTGLNMYASVKADAENHKAAATEEKLICPEDILRTRWLVSKGFKSETEE